MAVLQGMALAPKKQTPAPFALFTIPKSGSHLMIKTLYYMTGFTPYWHREVPDSAQVYLKEKFPYTHLCLTPELRSYYSQTPFIRQILAVRDLRDVSVSIVYQILKGRWPRFGNRSEKLAAFKELSFHDQLLYVINEEYTPVPPEFLQVAIRKVSEEAVLYANNSDMFVCRFEDLVGEEGGGSAKAQRETLCNLADFLDISLTHAEIREIAENLFGNEENPFNPEEIPKFQSTFRSGQIGGWRDVFEEEHKRAFKKRLGAALIALGYEKNNSW
jgi:hypothetical protein